MPATLTPAQITANNTAFLRNALKRNYQMTDKTFTKAGQVIDIELESVPGWATSLDLAVNVDLNLGAYTAAPTYSPFFPYNLFSSYEVSLGGGPFQRVNPTFTYLRRKAMNPGWKPGQNTDNQSYVSGSAWSIPAITTADNTLRFTLRVPLQAQPSKVYGLIPLGDATVTCKLRLTVAQNLQGTDQYENPVIGGTGVVAAIGTATTSTVSVGINFLTAPTTMASLPTPIIGSILNVQEGVTSFVGAGKSTPVQFKDPFTYLRLWHVIVNGSGNLDSADVNNFELDLTPGYPQYRYDTADAIQVYFDQMAELYHGYLDNGVFVVDLWSGDNSKDPNGNQMVDGRLFTTLQTRVGVAQSFNTASPAKIVTYAEALSPVGF